MRLRRQGPGTAQGAVAIAVLAIVALCGCGRGTTELRLITPPDRADRPMAEELAAAFDSADGVRIRLVPPPESGSAADALESGAGDLAFVANTEPYRKGLSALLPLYSTVLHIIVREERLGDDFREAWRDARIFAGDEGSLSRRVAERFLTNLELPEDGVRFVADPTTENPDIIVLYAPVQPEAAPALPGYRMISFGSPDDVGTGSLVDRAVLLNPSLRPFIVPMRTYGDLNPEPLLTVAVDELLVARESLEDTAAYDLVREYFRLRPVLAASRPAVFSGITEDFDATRFRLPLHPGANAYLDRDAPGWLERYSGVGEVLVTTLVALVSGTFAAVNIYRIRRKNRIDVFYNRVFAIVDGLPEGAGPADRASAIDRINALKREAFAKLVGEKLAANESFRIFLTLADDTIRDLEGKGGG